MKKEEERINLILRVYDQDANKKYAVENIIYLMRSTKLFNFNSFHNGFVVGVVISLVIFYFTIR